MSRNLWGPAQQAMLVDMAARRVPTVEIAKALGRTVDAVGQRAKVTGVRLSRKARPFTPLPEGFAEFAAERTSNDLAAHYGVTLGIVSRWVAKMPDDWQRSRKRIVTRIRIDTSLATRRQRFAETAADRAAAHEANADMLKQRQREASQRYWQRRKEKMRLKRQSDPKYALPADFAEVAATRSQVSLAKHYGRSSKIIIRWLNSLSAEQAEARLANMLKNSLAAAVAGTAKKERKPKEPKPAKPQKQASHGKTKPPGRPVNWGFRRPTEIAGPPLTLASQAADFLRRPPHRFSNVYDAEKVLGKAFKGMYYVGNLRCIPTEQMIQIARDRGFSL